METNYERELREARERGSRLPTDDPLIRRIQDTIERGWSTLVNNERDEAERRKRWLDGGK